MTKTQTTSTVRDALTGHFGATERTIRVNGKRVTVALTDKTAAALKDKNFRESKAERLLDKGEVVGAAYNEDKGLLAGESAPVIRAWAEAEGLLKAGQRGRVPHAVVKAYREAHGEAAPVKVVLSANSRIREWAIAQGLTVGTRGRVSETVKKSYHSAHAPALATA